MCQGCDDLNANIPGKAGLILIRQYVKYRFAVVIVVSINPDEGGQEVVKLTPCHICHSSMMLSGLVAWFPFRDESLFACAA